jgi:hypothetical protein
VSRQLDALVRRAAISRPLNLSVTRSLEHRDDEGEYGRYQDRDWTQHEVWIGLREEAGYARPASFHPPPPA